MVARPRQDRAVVADCASSPSLTGRRWQKRTLVRGGDADTVAAARPGIETARKLCASGGNAPTLTRNSAHRIATIWHALPADVPRPSVSALAEERIRCAQVGFTGNRLAGCTLLDQPSRSVARQSSRWSVPVLCAQLLRATRAANWRAPPRCYDERHAGEFWGNHQGWGAISWS
jgi:hypothetical protein